LPSVTPRQPRKSRYCDIEIFGGATGLKSVLKKKKESERSGHRSQPLNTLTIARQDVPDLLPEHLRVLLPFPQVFAISLGFPGKKNKVQTRSKQRQNEKMTFF